MRPILCLLAGLFIAGCAGPVKPPGDHEVMASRDVESYAMASCLADQVQPYLKDQGDAWASVIVQRSHGPIEPFLDVAGQVKKVNDHSEMTVMRVESGPAESKALPILHCHELIATPLVRDAIRSAAAKLAPFYRDSADPSMP
jgi:hypothetical protein